MCDYSLEHVASRPAVVTDRLMVTSFPGTITHGFAGTDDLKTAVCLRPGTEIAFDKPIRYVGRFFRWPRSAGTVAVFRQIDIDVAHTHHDALEFPNGAVVLLAQLVTGQYATVLQLPKLSPAGSDALLAQDTLTLDSVR
jgi:hypothetical protein